MMKPRVLVLAFSNLNHDARIARQIDFLKDSYDVTAICFDGPLTESYTTIKVSKPKLALWRKALAAILLLSRQYLRAHYLLYDYSDIKKLIRGNYHLVVANDIESLPFAVELNMGRILFDAHEYSPRHFEDKWVWRTFFQGLNKFLCREYLPKIHGMTTVGKGLAAEYEKEYGIRAIVVTNAAPYYELAPSPVSDAKIRLVHHGGANPSRKLELMIDMMSKLDDRFTLDMILITPAIANRKTKNYLNELRERAQQSGRVRILPPLKSHEIVAAINQYDMGIFLLPPVNFNYANTLPNKLFDFIQARLGVAIGPTPEMAEIVKKYNIGIVSGNFDPLALATELNKISTEELKQFKRNAIDAAKALNAEVNKQVVLNLVDQILRP